MEPTQKICGGHNQAAFSNFEAILWPWFIIQTLIKMKRVAEVMVLPTCLNLFLNHNHNCPSMLQLYLSPMPPSPHFFSNPFFFLCVCVKETLQLLGGIFSQLGCYFLFFFHKIPPLFSAAVND